MRKILAIMFISASLYAQTVVYEDVYFYADSVSSSVSLDKGSFLQGLFTPQGLSEYYTFQVSPDGTTYYTLTNADSTVYTAIVDSSQSNAFSLPEDKFKSWKYFKILIDQDIADANSVKAITSNR